MTQEAEQTTCPVCGMDSRHFVSRREWKPAWSDQAYCSQACARVERMAYALMTIGAGQTISSDLGPEQLVSQRPIATATPPAAPAPLPDRAGPLTRGPDPQTCPECGEPKDAKYDVCYKCKMKDAKPCDRCGKPVANPQYKLCYQCGPASNRAPVQDNPYDSRAQGGEW